MKQILSFRAENGQIFTNQINQMPDGLYDVIDCPHAYLLITHDSNILVSGFGHGISVDVLAETFQDAYVGYEYYETTEHAKDWLTKRNLIEA